MPEDNLEFLNFLSGSRKDYYQGSDWLKSDFYDDIWNLSFNDNNMGDMKIDFNVRLSNGSLLTDSVNFKLLNTFKYWINAVTHPDNTKGRGANYVGCTAKNLIDRVVTIIDYILINDQGLNITKYGLQAVTEDYLKNFIDRISSTKRKADSVYGWSTALRGYLDEKVTGSNKQSLDKVIENCSVDLKMITDTQIEEDWLGIPTNLIPYVRAWLWENGFYWRSRNHEYSYTTNTKKLAREIYGSRTLRGGAGRKPAPSILCLDQEDFTPREFPAVPVKDDDNDTISETAFDSYKKALKALLLLRDSDFDDEGLLLPPNNIIYAISTYSPSQYKNKRFSTVPSQIVFDAIKNAVEFHFNYADQLLWSFDNLLGNLRKAKQRSAHSEIRLSKVMTENQFVSSLHSDIRELGVKRWSSYKSGQRERYNQQRANRGLCELIRVYYGGVAILVGSLMARRQAELISLSSRNCLDETGKYLVFEKGKSTSKLYGHHEVVARPIDELAVEMIRNLIAFQKVFVKHGCIREEGKIFDTVSPKYPDVPAKVDSTRNVFNICIDYFCDYFETPLKDGQRYYIRTHQLRRFFALSFFWGSGFGGMDTLRWFLGHTDPEHLYRYITENNPGEVIRQAKSQFLSETIDEHEELVALIKDKYGTEDFTLLNTEDLELYIDELIKDGTVEVEPDFIEDGSGKSYKIAVIIRYKRDATH